MSTFSVFLPNGSASGNSSTNSGVADEPQLDLIDYSVRGHFDEAVNALEAFLRTYLRPPTTTASSLAAPPISKAAADGDSTVVMTALLVPGQCVTSGAITFGDERIQAALFRAARCDETIPPPTSPSPRRAESAPPADNRTDDDRSSDMVTRAVKYVATHCVRCGPHSTAADGIAHPPVFVLLTACDATGYTSAFTQDLLTVGQLAVDAVLSHVLNAMWDRRRQDWSHGRRPTASAAARHPRGALNQQAPFSLYVPVFVPSGAVEMWRFQGAGQRLCVHEPQVAVQRRWVSCVDVATGAGEASSWLLGSGHDDDTIEDAVAYAELSCYHGLMGVLLTNHDENHNRGSRSSRSRQRIRATVDRVWCLGTHNAERWQDVKWFVNTLSDATHEASNAATAGLFSGVASHGHRADGGDPRGGGFPPPSAAFGTSDVSPLRFVEIRVQWRVDDDPAHSTVVDATGVRSQFDLLSKQHRVATAGADPSSFLRAPQAVAVTAFALLPWDVATEAATALRQCVEIIAPVFDDNDERSEQHALANASPSVAMDSSSDVVSNNILDERAAAIPSEVNTKGAQEQQQQQHVVAAGGGSWWSLIGSLATKRSTAPSSQSTTAAQSASPPRAPTPPPMKPPPPPVDRSRVQFHLDRIFNVESVAAMHHPRVVRLVSEGATYRAAFDLAPDAASALKPNMTAKSGALPSPSAKIQLCLRLPPGSLFSRFARECLLLPTTQEMYVLWMEVVGRIAELCRNEGAAVALRKAIALLAVYDVDADGAAEAESPSDQREGHGRVAPRGERGVKRQVDLSTDGIHQRLQVLSICAREALQELENHTSERAVAVAMGAALGGLHPQLAEGLRGATSASAAQKDGWDDNDDLEFHSCDDGSEGSEGKIESRDEESKKNNPSQVGGLDVPGGAVVDEAGANASIDSWARLVPGTTGPRGGTVTDVRSVLAPQRYLVAPEPSVEEPKTWDDIQGEVKEMLKLGDGHVAAELRMWSQCEPLLNDMSRFLWVNGVDEAPSDYLHRLQVTALRNPPTAAITEGGGHDTRQPSATSVPSAVGVTEGGNDAPHRSNPPLDASASCVTSFRVLLADFVRWHSPRDFLAAPSDSQGRNRIDEGDVFGCDLLSARMRGDEHAAVAPKPPEKTAGVDADSNADVRPRAAGSAVNMWQSLWLRAAPRNFPPRRFNPSVPTRRSLDHLCNVTPEDILPLIVEYNMASAVFRMIACPHLHLHTLPGVTGLMIQRANRIRTLLPLSAASGAFLSDAAGFASMYDAALDELRQMEWLASLVLSLRATVFPSPTALVDLSAQRQRDASLDTVVVSLATLAAHRLVATDPSDMSLSIAEARKRAALVSGSNRDVCLDRSAAHWLSPDDPRDLAASPAMPADAAAALLQHCVTISNAADVDNVVHTIRALAHGGGGSVSTSPTNPPSTAEGQSPILSNLAATFVGEGDSAALIALLSKQYRLELFGSPVEDASGATSGSYNAIVIDGLSAFEGGNAAKGRREGDSAHGCVVGREAMGGRAWSAPPSGNDADGGDTSVACFVDVPRQITRVITSSTSRFAPL